MSAEPKYVIAKKEQIGRIALANCKLNPGETIFEEIPFVFGPKAGSSPVCLGCYAPVRQLNLCSKCFWPVCSVECETNAEHLKECQVFVSAKVRFQTVDDYDEPCPQYECITPLRFLLSTESNRKRWNNEVSAMESHNAIRKTQPNWQKEEINIVVFLREKCKLKDRFDADLVHTVCGILEVNAFEARTLSGRSIRALYPKLAILSHNCVPNTAHSIDPEAGFRVQLRASVSIKKTQELFVTYTNVLWPTIYRREHLLESKFFACTCRRCEDPEEIQSHTSTLKCSKCSQGYVLSTSPLDSDAVWKCTRCDMQLSGNSMKQMLKTIQTDIESIDSALDRAGIEKREELFRQYRSLCHPNHWFLINLRYSLIQMYGRVDDYLIEDLPDILLERKVELCEKLLEIANVISPGYTRLRGTILYELHTPLLFLARSHYQTDLIGRNEFLVEMNRVLSVLKQAADILSLEPMCTPEGVIGHVARQSIEHLQKSLDEFENN